jgi:hypothetical protein
MTSRLPAAVAPPTLDADADDRGGRYSRVAGDQRLDFDGADPRAAAFDQVLGAVDAADAIPSLNQNRLPKTWR